MFMQPRYHNTFLLNQSAIMQSIIVFLASLLLAASSQIVIPWQPIPFTLQSAVVVLLGLTLGSKRSAFAVTLYLFEGAIGLPVFAGFSSGLAALLGSSAGYLFGFLPAAFVAGWLAEQGMARSWLCIFLAGLCSAAVIFVAGVMHLQVIMGWKEAYLLGVQPFLLTEPAKLLLVSLLAKHCWKKGTYSL